MSQLTIYCMQYIIYYINYLQYFTIYYNNLLYNIYSIIVLYFYNFLQYNICIIFQYTIYGIFGDILFIIKSEI